MNPAPLMHQHWTAEQLDELKALWAAGVYDNAVLAERFGRSEKGIIKVRNRLGLRLPRDVYLSRLNCNFTARELEEKRVAAVAAISETEQWAEHAARATARLGEAIERMLRKDAA